ncbi:MAG: hypothetical protein RLP44_07615 [Aggregatilineales bacterium]
MPVTLRQIEGEPILLVTIDGLLNAEMVRKLYENIGKLAQEIDGPVYRITDVRKLETTFAELMGILKEAMKDSPGTTSDKNITNIFVGRDKFALLARDMLKRINQDNHPLFDTIEDALTFIQLDLIKRGKDSA